MAALPVSDSCARAGPAVLVQYWALLSNTLQLPLFKCRCMDKIIIKKYYFTPPLSSPQPLWLSYEQWQFQGKPAQTCWKRQ